MPFNQQPLPNQLSTQQQFLPQQEQQSQIQQQFQQQEQQQIQQQFQQQQNCFIQRCDQTISGRRFNYARELKLHAKPIQ